MFKERFKFYKRVNSLEQQTDIIDFANEVNTEFIVSYSFYQIHLLIKTKTLIYGYSFVIET